MFPRHLLLMTLAILFLPLQVTSVEISMSPSSLNEGDTLTITCREQSLPPGSGLLRLRLKKISDAGGYDDFIFYDVNLVQGDPYMQRWGNTVGSELQQRANVTSSFDLNRMYGSFEVRIHSVRCSDPASFRCDRTAQGTAGTQTTSVQNVTISGVTQNVQVTGALDCTMFADPDCYKCQNFDDPFGVKPRYARMGEAVELTCAGQMTTPQSQNKAIWYKQTVNDLQKAMITVNTSDLTYDPPSPNACTVYGRSTLTYYPQDTDRQLRISCEVSSPNSPDIVGDEMSICVQGQILTSSEVSTPGPYPSTIAAEMDFQLCENMLAISKRYGGGDIAGAVLGGAFGGALLALLLTFTILRCTGYTLTGSKQRHFREPRRYIQESHPTPPREHQSGPTVTPGRDVTISYQANHATVEVSPNYYNVQQDPAGYYNTIGGNMAGNAPYEVINNTAQSAPVVYERMNPRNDDGKSNIYP